ncbi:MAG TPA: NUDIX hydrolase [Candidatus Binatia bacterium]|jgi:ADP-ribose pyrophosphatase YjhB (NUDIX family)
MDKAITLLRKRYGKVPLVQPALTAADFPPLRGGRRAEVGMAIRRPSGGILLQTKAFYPPDTFRLPTGGIKVGEDVEHALMREVYEESNLSVEIDRPIAVIEHTTSEGRVGFRSYLFLVRETGGELKVNDPDEQISGWDERDVEGLRAASAQLRTLGGTWQRWGQFRALALDVLVNALA